MKADLDIILSHTKQTTLGCLEWTRCLNTDGYARAVINGNANAKVHRIVWELYNNASACGKVVRHRCDNIKCINPDHLEIGDVKDNNLDRDLRDRSGSAKLKIKDVKAIRALLSQGFKRKDLAKMFDVSYNTIASIDLNQTWTNIMAGNSAGGL